MKARDIVGRRVVRLTQTRFYDERLGQMVVALDAIELDNGTIVVFHGDDDGVDNYVTTQVVRP